MKVFDDRDDLRCEVDPYKAAGIAVTGLIIVPVCTVYLVKGCCAVKRRCGCCNKAKVNAEGDKGGQLGSHAQGRLFASTLTIVT